MSVSRTTPLCLRLMLLAYYSADPMANLDESMMSPPGKDFQYWLKTHGLVDNNMRATERGKAWVEFILSTPLPVAKWTLPERPAS